MVTWTRYDLEYVTLKLWLWFTFNPSNRSICRLNCCRYSSVAAPLFFHPSSWTGLCSPGVFYAFPARPDRLQTACHIISSCSLVSYPFPCYFPWLRNFRFALLAKNCLNSLLFNNLRCSTNLVKLYKNNCFTTKVEIYAYYPFLIRCESFGSALMRSISSATICLTSLLMR